MLSDIAHSICSRDRFPDARRPVFCCKSAFVPRRLVVGYEGEFRRENPPLAIERQIAALHIGQRYILSAADFARVFGKPAPQCALALSYYTASVKDG
jgi:hypothetical protein